MDTPPGGVDSLGHAEKALGGSRGGTAPLEAYPPPRPRRGASRTRERPFGSHRRRQTLSTASDDLEILAAEPTALGLITLQERRAASDPDTRVLEIALDHEFLMSSLSTASEEALSTQGLALCAGDALEVLVGGLGLGFTARAALACERVARVEVVELLEPILRWHREGLTPLARELDEDGRLELVQGDVYARLLAPPDRLFDALLIDVDHSPEDALGSSAHAFHSKVGLQAVARHLRPGGILGVWSYAESPRFVAAMEAAFLEVQVRPLRFRNAAIDDDEVNWLFFGRR